MIPTIFSILSQNTHIQNYLKIMPFATFNRPFATCGEWQMGWTTLSQTLCLTLGSSTSSGHTGTTRILVVPGSYKIVVEVFHALATMFFQKMHILHRTAKLVGFISAREPLLRPIICCAKELLLRTAISFHCLETIAV